MLLNDPLFWVVAFSALVVLGILLVGIVSFGRGGEFHKRNSNRIMRYRVAAQGIAIALILGFVLIRNYWG